LAASTFSDNYQRPARWLMVANRIFALPFRQHAPQPAGVVMHHDLADAGEGDRAGTVVVTDTDCLQAAFAVLVAQPK